MALSQIKLFRLSRFEPPTLCYAERYDNSPVDYFIVKDELRAAQY